MNRIHLAAFLSLCLIPSAFAGLTVSSNFPGGNAAVISVDSEGQAVQIEPEVHVNQGWPCWWYFRLDGLSVGDPVSITVSANRSPYDGTRVLSRSWLLPDQAAYSDDNIHWKQSPRGDVKDKAATYVINASATTMWFAWGPPFLASHAASLLKQSAETLPDAEIFELAKTRRGRSVTAIRFGRRATDGSEPLAVWVQARQHAWEAGSSWVAQGFLKWAVGDDPAAVALRQKATLVVVPVMDVDNVTDGAGGKDSVPRDHNRDWDNRPVYSEVAAAQAEILKMDQQHRFDVFVDLHNPGPSDRKPFFYGPRLEDLSDIQRSNYKRWHAIAHTFIGHLEPEFRFPSYVKSTEEYNRMSGNWVRNHTSPHVVALTLETAWNRPEGTQEGYQLVGQQLGMTLARYLSIDPRDDGKSEGKNEP